MNEFWLICYIVAFVISTLCWICFFYREIRYGHSPYPVWIALAFMYICNLGIQIYK